MKISDLPSKVVEKFRSGVVIPAHPLALTEDRKLDVKHQKALTRYYIDAGAGGIAVGVHSTQFEIREPGIDLFKPVLTLASETIDQYCAQSGKEMIFKIAGVCGNTEQAQNEAQFAYGTGYHACLLSLSALGEADIDTLLGHCRTIAGIMPIVGFYLQPSVGGRVLPYEFWREFAEIDNVIAIKISPFNRYQTLDVVRAICEAGREKDITLYTGNDDNILIDLLTDYIIYGK
jgi:dihydrodipicolinate synthase/N-acetylneuraminate lyase